MRKRAFIVSAIAFIAGVGWLLFDALRPLPPAPAVAASTRPQVVAAGFGAPAPTVAVEKTEPSVQKLAEALGPKTLDVKSDEFRERIDEIIPNKFYAEAANRCYRKGLGRDEKVKLSYSLKISDGQVTPYNVTVLETTMTDKSVVNCIVDSVARAKVEDREMPDWESTDEELLIRVKGFKKYLENQEESGL